MNAELQYHPVTPKRFRRARRPLLIITSIALAILAWKFAPALSNRVILLNLQRQCMNDAPPADQAVFDTRPDSLPQWQRSDPNFITGTIGPRAYVARMPSHWTRYLTRAGLPSGSTALIALHRLRDPAGREFLVAADAIWTGPPAAPYLTIIPRAIRPANMLRSAVELGDDSEFNLASFTPDEALAIYIDPPDTARRDRITFRVVGTADTRTFELRLTSGDVAAIRDITPPTPP